MRARALAFAYRFSSGVRVSWASSTAFATLGTAVVTLLVLPLLVQVLRDQHQMLHLLHQLLLVQALLHIHDLLALHF